MQLKIKQIFLPKVNTKNEHVTYENQLQPRVIFGDTNLEELYNINKELIWKHVVDEIMEYVNTDDICNNDKDMFPRRCELTGEWYVGEINFEEESFLSISTRFLTTYNAKKEDYLELEVIFYYDEDTKSIKYDGINSSCI